jgi:hypothetical protein
VHVAVIGRGNVGGGLARKWERAGHTVTEIGRDGGDASAADVLLVAVPSRGLAEALANVGDVRGKVAIDATNAFTGRDEGFESLAHQVKSIVGGPVAKSFNLNFARLYDEVESQDPRPSNLWAGDDEAAGAVERLSRDAGYEPVRAGGLEHARLLEDSLALLTAVGPSFHRFWTA